MKWNWKSLWSLIKESVKQWSDDYASSMGAALAYYTIFSIAPLLVIVIAVAGFFFGEKAASGQIFDQLRGLVGEHGASTIQAAVASASQTGHGVFAAVAGIVALLLGATTVFNELQTDLDRIWDTPKPESTGIWGMIRSKVLSFGVVLGIGFLLLVSLVLSAGISALGKFWSGWFPGWEIVLQAINFIVSFAVVTGLFALIYKLLPRCHIGWHDVWIGAGVTSLLFSIGKFLIGLYLGSSSVASSFGAAGSLVIVLLWVYYSAQIFLLGAEFTRTYSYRHGSRSGKAMPEKSGKPTQATQGEATSSTGGPSSAGESPRKPDVSAPPPMSPSRLPTPTHGPAWSRLRLAAGVAAAVGLVAGEVLNELRRLRRLPRRA